MNLSLDISQFKEDMSSMLPVLGTSGIMGVLAGSASVTVLVISQFKSAGDTSFLVFIRCLCVSDLLIGISGLLKTIFLVNIDILMVNCFLPESLFISALSASIFILCWLNVDCMLHLYKPKDKQYHMEKSNVISGAVILWNSAFIVGFVPLMGWNNIEYDCVFFHYYAKLYLLFLALVWILAIMVCSAIQIKTFQIIGSIRQQTYALNRHSKEYKKYESMVQTVRIELITWSLCFAPFFLYIVICFSIYGDPSVFPYVNLFIPCSMLVFAFRSLINAILNGYKTNDVHKIVRQVSRRLSASFRRRRIYISRNRLRNAEDISHKRGLDDKKYRGTSRTVGQISGMVRNNFDNTIVLKNNYAHGTSAKQCDLEFPPKHPRICVSEIHPVIKSNEMVNTFRCSKCFFKRPGVTSVREDNLGMWMNSETCSASERISAFHLAHHLNYGFEPDCHKELDPSKSWPISPTCNQRIKQSKLRNSVADQDNTEKISQLGPCRTWTLGVPRLSIRTGEVVRRGSDSSVEFENDCRRGSKELLLSCGKFTTRL